MNNQPTTPQPMTDQHPITPPPELVQQWASESLSTQRLCTQAAQWGYEQRGAVNEAKLQKVRDEELEACVEWLERERCKGQAPQWIVDLRAARRPKPKSLKEQALAALERWAEDKHRPRALFHKGLKVDLIRRALEALDD